MCQTISSVTVLVFVPLSTYAGEYPLLSDLIVSVVLYMIGYSEFKEGRRGILWAGLGIYALIASCAGFIFLRMWLDAVIAAAVAGIEIWHWSKRNGRRKPAG